MGSFLTKDVGTARRKGNGRAGELFHPGRYHILQLWYVFGMLSDCSPFVQWFPVLSRHNQK
jgi:hypothetical protein